MCPHITYVSSLHHIKQALSRTCTTCTPACRYICVLLLRMCPLYRVLLRRVYSAESRALSIYICPLYYTYTHTHTWRVYSAESLALSIYMSSLLHIYKHTRLEGILGGVTGVVTVQFQHGLSRQFYLGQCCPLPRTREEQIGERIQKDVLPKEKICHEIYKNNKHLTSSWANTHSHELVEQIAERIYSFC